MDRLTVTNIALTAIGQRAVTQAQLDEGQAPYLQAIDQVYDVVRKGLLEAYPCHPFGVVRLHWRSIRSIGRGPYPHFNFLYDLPSDALTVWDILHPTSLRADDRLRYKVGRVYRNRYRRGGSPLLG